MGFLLESHPSPHLVHGIPCRCTGKCGLRHMTDLNQIVQLGQQLQAKMSKLQEELDRQTLTATSGGGMVEVSVDGKGTVKALRIDPAVVDPGDVEMLEDLVLAATSEAQGRARTAYEEEIRKATGGLPMNLPGLF